MEDRISSTVWMNWECQTGDACGLHLRQNHPQRTTAASAWGGYRRVDSQNGCVFSDASTAWRMAWDYGTGLTGSWNSQWMENKAELGGHWCQWRLSQQEGGNAKTLLLIPHVHGLCLQSPQRGRQTGMHQSQTHDHS